MSRDYNEYPPDHQAAMENLYNEVLDSDVTRCGVDFLYRARLLLRVADHDPHVAKEVIHKPAGREAAEREFDALTDAERAEVGAEVGEHWATAVRHAIGRLWHAAIVLDIDPTGLEADHVALHAATLLSGEPGPFAPDTPLDGDADVA